MAAHYRISPNFWKTRRHWSDRQRTLALYVMTCQHRNLEGLYWLPAGYVQSDLGWPAKAVEDTMRFLEEDGMVAYDRQSEVLFLCKALRHQAPATDKQLIGAINELAQVPVTSLWDRFVVACESYAPKLANRIRMELESHSNGIPNLIANGLRSDSDIARTLSSNSNSSSSSTAGAQA